MNQLDAKINKKLTNNQEFFEKIFKIFINCLIIKELNVD